MHQTLLAINWLCWNDHPNLNPHIPWGLSHLALNWMAVSIVMDSLCTLLNLPSFISFHNFGHFHRHREECRILRILMHGLTSLVNDRPVTTCLAGKLHDLGTVNWEWHIEHDPSDLFVPFRYRSTIGEWHGNPPGTFDWEHHIHHGLSAHHMPSSSPCNVKGAFPATCRHIFIQLSYSTLTKSM